MVSCSGFGLPMHAQLLRLFVTSCVFAGAGTCCARCGCRAGLSAPGALVTCVCAFDGFLL